MIEDTRINEWFVPKFGPSKFRAFVGLLFLPYTGMCISFTVIGSLIASEVSWERLAGIAIIYTLALGISAHAADSLGSKKTKPWGKYFSKRELGLLTIIPMAAAYSIGAYFIILYVPNLLIIAILEGFFLLAYNFELFRGKFHNNISFAFSWGSLPVLAGFMIQTNSIDFIAITASIGAGLVSYVEIRTSRPYKDLKRTGSDDLKARKLENRLKLLSTSTFIFAILFLVFRLIL
jgi:hypothetical protein